MDAIRILFLENNVQDYELMRFELKKAGMPHVPKRVIDRKDFLAALTDFEPDIILSDYALPMFNGMHAFRLFKERKPYIPFILVTGTLSEELALECQGEGLDDFLLKSNIQLLPIKITRCLELKKLEKQRDELEVRLKKQTDELTLLQFDLQTHQKLSAREFEVFMLLANDRCVKEIAAELSISPSTVATYRARVLDKLNLKSDVELCKFALRNRLIE